MFKRKNSDVEESDAKRVAVEVAQPSPRTPSTESKPAIVSSHKLNAEIDPATFIHIRLLVSLSDAVATIGKSGNTIAKIRDATGIRLNVSDFVPGIQDRVVNLKGSAEHVSKVSSANLIHYCIC